MTVKLVFNCFKIKLEEDDVALFIRRLEALAREFAGQAYHFRYQTEEHALADEPRMKRQSGAR